MNDEDFYIKFQAARARERNESAHEFYHRLNRYNKTHAPFSRKYFIVFGNRNYQIFAVNHMHAAYMLKHQLKGSLPEGVWLMSIDLRGFYPKDSTPDGQAMFTIPWNQVTCITDEHGKISFPTY